MDYFASLNPDELAKECQKKVDDYFSWILNTDRLARWRIAYNTYYGQRGQHNSSYVSAGGEKGELSFLMSNEYRNLVQHILIMTMQSRPSIEMVTTSTESKAKASAYLAQGVVEYYRRDGKIDFNTNLAAEISLIFDTAWVFNEWDRMAGDEIRPDIETGEMLRTGDISSRAKTPLEVIIDYAKQDGVDRDWLIVKDRKNKYDLAAANPDKADQIISIKRDAQTDAIYAFGEQTIGLDSESDDIDVFTFYHRKSPALPTGRMFQFINSNLWFFDKPLPYPKIPGNRIAACEQIMSSLGYSNSNDLLGLQDVLDALISSGVTNMTTCAFNNIWSKPSPNFDYEQIASGMNHIESDEKPEVIIMNKLPPEWFNMANFVIGRMEALSAVNSVARGNIQGKDLSGAAMALLQSMSIQFNSGFQKSVNSLIEANANDVLMLTQRFVGEKKLGMIVGPNNKYMVKQYSGNDLDGVKRAFCRQGNPMKDTTAGKMELLKIYQNIPNAIVTPAQVTEVLDTGNLQSFTEKDRNDKLLIDMENEALMRGESVPVHFSDIHPEHFKGHKSIFASPEARRDVTLINTSKEHWDMHMKTWQETDPATLMALGIPPFPQVPPPMMGDDGLPPPDNGAPQQSGQPPQELAPTDPAQLEGMPSMPQNPLSKQKWNPETGGLPQ